MYDVYDMTQADCLMGYQNQHYLCSARSDGQRRMYGPHSVAGNIQSSSVRCCDSLFFLTLAQGLVFSSPRLQTLDDRRHYTRPAENDRKEKVLMSLQPDFFQTHLKKCETDIIHGASFVWVKSHVPGSQASSQVYLRPPGRWGWRGSLLPAWDSGRTNSGSPSEKGLSYRIFRIESRLALEFQDTNHETELPSKRVGIGFALYIEYWRMNSD